MCSLRTQLAILHSGSFIGRITGSVVSAYAGVPNTTVASSLISSAIIFTMIGLRSVASVVLIGFSYGYFGGVCACGLYRLSDSYQISIPGITMMVPLISLLTPDISDLG
jgi:hypothetical protein